MLFNDTILHNVAYGRPGACMGDVRAAAAAAKLDAAITRMPAGGRWKVVHLHLRGLPGCFAAFVIQGLVCLLPAGCRLGSRTGLQRLDCCLSPP